MPPDSPAGAEPWPGGLQGRPRLLGRSATLLQAPQAGGIPRRAEIPPPTRGRSQPRPLKPAGPETSTVPIYRTPRKYLEPEHPVRVMRRAARAPRPVPPRLRRPNPAARGHSLASPSGTGPRWPRRGSEEKGFVQIRVRASPRRSPVLLHLVVRGPGREKNRHGVSSCRGAR